MHYHIHSIKKQNPFRSNFIKLATVSERQAPTIHARPRHRGSLSLLYCRHFNKFTSERVLFLQQQMNLPFIAYTYLYVNPVSLNSTKLLI